MRISTGEWIYTDPNNPDTDGDGIKDGEEVNYIKKVRSLKQINTAVHFFMSSDPNKVDSDNDGIVDAIDPKTMVYSITDRTLALSATLSYTNLKSSIGKLVGDKGESELSNWKIVSANDSGAGYWGDFGDSGLGKCGNQNIKKWRKRCNYICFKRN